MVFLSSFNQAYWNFLNKLSTKTSCVYSVFYSIANSENNNNNNTHTHKTREKLVYAKTSPPGICSIEKS